jgi:hypothetical protein
MAAQSVACKTGWNQKKTKTMGLAIRGAALQMAQILLDLR